MGPRLLSRGEVEQSNYACNVSEVLQWGRGFSAAERCDAAVLYYKGR